MSTKNVSINNRCIHNFWEIKKECMRKHNMPHHVIIYKRKIRIFLDKTTIFDKNFKASSFQKIIRNQIIIYYEPDGSVIK